MIVDLHTHTHYSYDAKGELEENVLAAIDKGISIMGITEHVDFFRKAEHIMSDVDAERKEIEYCREKYGNKIRILAGVEIGEPHACPKDANAFLDSHDFDYVIGSIHAMPNDLDLYFHDYANLDCDKLLHEYFDEQEKMLDFGRFHVLAHLDYPLRVMKLPDNYPSFANYMDRVDVILKKVIEKGVAFETNGKSMRSWIGDVGPERFVMERYKELGGELVSVGSDSHSPDQMGHGVPEAMDRLRDIGFRYVHLWENGGFTAIPL